MLKKNKKTNKKTKWGWGWGLWSFNALKSWSTTLAKKVEEKNEDVRVYFTREKLKLFKGIKGIK